MCLEMSQKKNQHRNNVLKENQSCKMETAIVKKEQQPNGLKTDKPKLKPTEIQQEKTAK